MSEGKVNVERSLKIAVIGAGVRGTSLARQLSFSSYNAIVVAVAEPEMSRREDFAAEFGLPGKAVFSGWEELTENLGECDAAIIATLDNQHTGPALACLSRGWDILIEKPLADTLEDCRLIVGKQKEQGKVVAVCHTLRFMEGFRIVKQLLTDGNIGELVHIEHMEAIGHMRFAHNYVRGRWAREKENTVLLLHKCSHDIDYICWLFNEPCTKVSSFGSLKYFISSNAPEGSTERCTGGCATADICPYSSVRIYVDSGLNDWPSRDISSTHTKKAHLEAVKNGPFGLCVWRAGNDVVDHQVVMMEFEGGATATCTLTGYSATNGRRIRLQGTRGEMLFDEASGTIAVKKFTGEDEKIIYIRKPDSYHPEDQEIVNEWLSSLVSSTTVTVDASEALRTHAVVFAAEKSRKENRTVSMTEVL